MQGGRELIERRAKTQAFTRIGANLCSYVFSMSWKIGVTTCTPRSTDFTVLSSWKELRRLDP